MSGATDGSFRLQILHASDQEAGVPALQDAIGLSAVMNKLDGRFENTLKLTSSVVADVNGEPVGVVGLVTPYLPTIANIGGVAMLTGSDIAATTPIDAQVDALIGVLVPELEQLTQAGVDKIVLMTHLQEAEIEQALAQELIERDIPVDLLIGGGSHRVMTSDDGVPPLRQDETQQDSGQLLQPYPQEFTDGEDTLYYVNTGSNYRYLSQLVVRFNDEGEIVGVNPNSGTFATDIAGVDRLYHREVADLDDVRALADPELVAIVDGVGQFVNALDADIFGQSDVFLNGIRGDVRTQETNLGNLTADANAFYAEQYLAADPAILPGFTEIDVSFKNGGGIRDIIGQSFVAGGGGELIQLPTAANPNVGKEEGDVSRLDISNSLRFDNDLVVGTVTADGLFQLAEHMVSAVEFVSGRFGQIGGMAFSFDPTAAAGARIENLAVLNDDGTVKDIVVQDGALVGDAARTFSVVTLSFLAQDLGTGVAGDSYPLVIQDQVLLGDLAEPATLGRAELDAGGEQDALAEYLASSFNEDAGQAPFGLADTAQAEDQRIQNLDFRVDTVLSGISDFIM